MSASPWTIRCPSCSTDYDLPPSFCEKLVGKAVSCDECRKDWIPFPATGLLAKMASGPAEVVPIDLGAYRKDSGISLSPAASGPEPEAGTGSGFRTTARVTPSLMPGQTPMLRVTAEGPDVDTRAVFDLGPRSFLIGKSGCHLNLPSSTLPARAIRVRTTKTGFAFEGIGGFAIPIGPMSVHSGQIDGSAPLSLGLTPYNVTLEISTTPGSPIADLETAAGAPPPIDLRSQIPASSPAPRGAAPAPAGSSETMRDLMAPGHAAQSFRDPLQGLQVGFVGMEGAFQNKGFRITKNSAVIGRTAGDIVIPDNRVSSKHAQFDVLGFDHYSIKDLASTNGTTVNGRAISQTAIKNGDTVSFGGLPFKFVVKSGK